MKDYQQLALDMHEKYRGKIEITSKVPVETKDDLSTAYTPGVAEPCRRIHQDRQEVYRYTAKGNLVAVVSDGTAVLGLGDIGPEASLPVMEGKAILFKTFAGVDAFPLCLSTKDVDEIVETVVRVAPTFGGINLEDISSPRCVEIERKLKEQLDIPIFHDDQHGTAVVVTAALFNAIKVVKKDITSLKVVLNGAGAAGNAIVRMLRAAGVKEMLVCDRNGILSRDQDNGNWVKDELAEMTNEKREKGSLADALVGADVFIGVSAKDLVTEAMVSAMAPGAIVLPMANPDPEIHPDLAEKAGAAVVGTGRSDFKNQINNVLAFPGIFRGALDARASDINEEMKIAAARAIAGLVSEEELSADYIIPSSLDASVARAVAEAVYDAAVASGVARI